MPAMIVLFSSALDAFNKPAQLETEIEKVAVQLVVLGVLRGVGSAISRLIFKHTSGRLYVKLKQQFIYATLDHDTEWHTNNPCSTLQYCFGETLPAAKDVFGIKLAGAFMFVGQAVGSIAIALYYSWELTLVSLGPFMVLMGGSGCMMISFLTGQEKMKAEAYEVAGALADEVLSLVRTVISYGTFRQESKLFRAKIGASKAEGQKIGHRQGLVQALSLESTLLLLMAFSFWYGCMMARRGDAEFLDIFVSINCVILFGVATASTLSYVSSVSAGRVAAARIVEITGHESTISGLSAAGICSAAVRGEITVDKACFAYPSAPDQQVLHDLSFTARPGQTVAFVGHSGCGKSTIINLLMRFYDATSGSVAYDGVRIEDYNVEWLRAKVGLVAQQPPLLPTTIRDNIAIGKRGATDDEVIEAAKVANAHEFIMGFPEQYDTEVGTLGGKLSGGQRQRIAIASIMISQPSILILDEATSALDSVSEAKFQSLLMATRSQRSTIVVAHRLSTIRDADEIIVLDHGRVLERGTHDTLVAKRGRYYAMLHAQDDSPDSGSGSSEGPAPPPSQNSKSLQRFVGRKHGQRAAPAKRPSGRPSLWEVTNRQQPVQRGSQWLTPNMSDDGVVASPRRRRSSRRRLTAMANSIGNAALRASSAVSFNHSSEPGYSDAFFEDPLEDGVEPGLSKLSRARRGLSKLSIARRSIYGDASEPPGEVVVLDAFASPGADLDLDLDLDLTPGAFNALHDPDTHALEGGEAGGGVIAEDGAPQYSEGDRAYTKEWVWRVVRKEQRWLWLSVAMSMTGALLLCAAYVLQAKVMVSGVATAAGLGACWSAFGVFPAGRTARVSLPALRVAARAPHGCARREER